LSIGVEPREIADQLVGRPYAFVLTNADGRVHVVSLRPRVEADMIEFDRAGRSTTDDVAKNPRVTIVWPASSAAGEHADYSLIADGDGVVVDGRLRVTIRNAVLHRPA
jgi:hypothetical protein